MILVDDPVNLIAIVRAARRSTGIPLSKLAAGVAADTGRRYRGTVTQFYDWESGKKTPQLPSIGPYLQAHGLRLALLENSDQVAPIAASPWCDARRRDPHRSRCAMATGHAMPHRTYAGVDFR